MSTEHQNAINIRYSELSSTSCCLSCGGAVNHSEATAGEVCVDLGSGRGQDVIRLAETVGETGFVYGIDLSDGMISKARKNAEKFGVKNVKFLQSTLEELPVESAAADLVISNCTINHADDKRLVWKEIARVLKPGGRFVVSDIYSLEEVPDEYRNDPKAVAECWAGAVTREAYVTQLEAAGFTEVTVIEESSPYDKGEIQVASWTIRGVKPV
jgi:arsenite methyltransferase